MEKYPRGTRGPFSIPLLIKAEILFGEKHGLGQDGIGKDGLMWAGSQTHCSDALISQICLLLGRTLIMNKRTPGCISDLQLLQAFIKQLSGTQPVQGNSKVMQRAPDWRGTNGRFWLNTRCFS